MAQELARRKSETDSAPPEPVLFIMRGDLASGLPLSLTGIADPSPEGSPSADGVEFATDGLPCGSASGKTSSGMDVSISRFELSGIGSEL